MSALLHLLHPHERDIGFPVKRLLPAGMAQTVGPFIFFDHMGPATFASGTTQEDVRPHPHIVYRRQEAQFARKRSFVHLFGEQHPFGDLERDLPVHHVVFLLFHAILLGFGREGEAAMGHRVAGIVADHPSGCQLRLNFFTEFFYISSKYNIKHFGQTSADFG